MIRMRVVLLVSAIVVATASAAGAAGSTGPGGGPSGYVPGQYIAKIYTEALGRLPDQQAWQSAADTFSKDGCGTPTLAAFARQIYTSKEFLDLDYDNASRLLALYRGVLNREPDQAGFDHWLSRMSKGTSWRSTVDAHLDAAEFGALTRQICSGAVDSGDTSYNFGTQAPLSIFTTGAGFTGSETELQIQLDKAKPGDTVALAQRAVVVLTSELTVPAGVTLTTTGNPDPAHYANMGRLVRGAPFNREMVALDNGAQLRNVWIDGERDTPKNWAASRADLRLNGGTGTTAADNKISNTAGPSSIFVLGAFDHLPCKDLAVTGNVITAYSSSNYDLDTWTDGVSVTCGDTEVSGNQIVDTSDVAIVLYRASDTIDPVPQASQVHDNTILSAGNSMYGALVADPLFVAKGAHTEQHDFTGAKIYGNTMWTSPNTHFDIGLVAGTRAWFGRNTNTGSGTTITGNTTGDLTARVQIGIAVDGMRDAAVSKNATHWVHPDGIGRCPRANFAIDPSTASGTFSPKPDYRHSIDSCIGHNSKSVVTT